MAKKESEQVIGWAQLIEDCQNGEIPKWIYASKGTLESQFRREHFEFLDAHNIKIQVSSRVPDLYVYYSTVNGCGKGF